jgi:exopolysaccharide biosynthesis predicted pyruvyltransferase EpsI
MRAHLRGPSNVALVGFPNHPNVGDSAIWLGERAWLSGAGHRVSYAADLISYSPRAMGRAIGHDGVILLHGGGNLGDVWPMHQALRERVMKEFSGHRIIQLPQTAHFRSGRALDRARRVFESCSDLVIIARDDETQSRLRQQFDIRVDLAPDAAFVLGTRAVARVPAADVIWLARTDSESTLHLQPPPGSRVQTIDWLDDDVGRLLGVTDGRIRSLVQTWGRRSRRVPPATVGFQRLLLPAFDLLASRRLSYGLGVLATGRIVITDRLHGHILCLLLGIPHVVVDTGYGKLRSFYNTWTRDCATVRYSRDAEDVLRLATELASSQNLVRGRTSG